MEKNKIERLKAAKEWINEVAMTLAAEMQGTDDAWQIGFLGKASTEIADIIEELEDEQIFEENSREKPIFRPKKS